MTETMRFLGLSTDGGKDSLSMGTKINGKDVYSPNNHNYWLCARA